MGSDASVTICADANGLAEGAAQLVVDAAHEAAEARGRFMLCLAGGATPRATYERLARPPLSARMPWDRTWIFFGDERAVAPDDDESNYRMAQEALLSRVPVVTLPRSHTGPAFARRFCTSCSAAWLSPWHTEAAATAR